MLQFVNAELQVAQRLSELMLVTERDTVPPKEPKLLRVIVTGVELDLAMVGLFGLSEIVKS